MNYLIMDLATCPIAGAADYLEEPTAPDNYKDPAKISTYIAEKRAAALAKAALDPDTGRISAIGRLAVDADDQPVVTICQTEDDERAALTHLARVFLDPVKATYATCVGYNALRFDWPFLIRRAQYLGVPLTMNLDRYRSPHIDLMDRLTHRGILPSRSLGFYVRRLGWTDLVKPLSGAEEARAPKEGRWVELVASVVHDVTATARLAAWMGVLTDQHEAVSV